MSYGFHSLPPGLRLRRVQPLTLRDGSSSLLYDLERGHLVAVPVEFSYHVAAALDTGNLDGDLIAWLAGEDVLTYDSPPDDRLPDGLGSGFGHGLLDPGNSFDDADPHRDDLDRVFFAGDEIHCRLGGLEAEPAMRTVRSVLRRARPESRIVLHLSTPPGGGFPEALLPVAIAVRDGALEEMTAAHSVDLELLTDGRGLGRYEVQFLASCDFLVRLTGPHLPALNLLIDEMPERLVMSIRLDTEDRLRDLWSEALAFGAKRVDAVKVTDKPFVGLHRHESELRRFRRDLFAISDHMFSALERGDQPMAVYEPIAQVVARHMARRARSHTGGYLGVVSRGELLNLSQDGMRHRAEPEAEAGFDDAASLPEAQAGTAACRTCWARELCVRGRWAGPAADPYRPQPRADRCEFWRAEVEAGLLFYERLRQADLRHLTGFAEGRTEQALDPYAHLGTGQLLTF